LAYSASTDFHLEYGIDQSTPRFNAAGGGAGDPTDPTIFTAVQD
jgi:hypothetical protein